MAKQITQLPVAASVAASDVFPLDQSGTTKQATLTAIAAGLPAGTGTGGLVRQTNPTINGASRIVDSISAFIQCTNTSAPSDKKSIRLSAENSGLIGLSRVNDAESVITSFIACDINNNIGLGTTTPTQRLSVNGNIDCATVFSQFVSVINNFPQVTCTTSAGYGWRFHNTSNGASLGYCIIQGTTDNFASSFINGLQVNTNGSCVIGPGSSAVQNVYTAVLSGYAPAAIPANDGVQFVDVSVTGATNSMVCMVECPGPAVLSNNSIILKANYIAADTVRVYWINPTAVSVTLSATSYRIACIKF